LHGRIYFDTLSFIFRSSLIDGKLLSMKKSEGISEDSLLIKLLENNKYDSLLLINESYRALGSSVLYVTMFRKGQRKHKVKSYRFPNWYGIDPSENDMVPPH